MTSNWSYGENLEDEPRDLARFLLGDVVQTRYSPSDSELDYWLGVYTIDGVVDTYAAAAEVARAMAGRFQTLAATSIQIGGMKLDTDYKAAADRYINLATDLLAGRGDPGVGGVRRRKDGPDNQFRIGMWDNPNA